MTDLLESTGTEVNLTNQPNRILTTGSREWKNETLMEKYLEIVETLLPPPYTLIHGGARGADQMAAKIARKRGWKAMECAADWGTYGNSAGPRRNESMISTYQPVIALAFRKGGSAGTTDCLQRLYKEQRRANTKLKWILVADEP